MAGAIDDVFDQFVAFVTHGALPLHEGKVEVVAVGGLGSGQHGEQALELHGFRGLQADPIEGFPLLAVWHAGTDSLIKEYGVKRR